MVAPMKTRCRACQLQLCKSRDEPPHGQLIVLDPAPTTVPTQTAKVRGVKPWNSRDTAYTCQSCGDALVHSSDKAEAGWRKLAA